MSTNLKETLRKLKQKRVSVSIGTLAMLFVLMVITNIGGVGNLVSGAAPSPVINAFVVNNGSNPVPVNGSVGIVGIPGVNIVNTITNPVFVRDVDNPATQPFQEIQRFDSEEVTVHGNFSTVPEGKRLVIEYASARISLPANGDKVLYIALRPNSPVCCVEDYQTFLPLEFQGTDAVNGRDYYEASKQIKAFTGPGKQVKFEIVRKGPGGSLANVIEGEISISGYYVNLPPPPCVPAQIC